ncbi:MAG: fimbrillin family protein [Bacteroidales bacterium]|nr:fimbrillin family protein [Bacteroidales bacterium]
MKKLFVLSCVALATLASCSKSEDIEAPQAQKEIAFNVATDKSRAPIEDATFPTALSMYVSAYNSVSKDYFKNVEFKHNSGTWKAGMYWPINGVTNFLAYAFTPAADTQTTAVMDANKAKWGDTSDANWAQQMTFDFGDKSLCYALVAVDGSAVADPMTPYVDLLYASGEQAKEKDYTSVSMTFKHTGAWIVFKVKLNDALLDKTSVTLNQFKLVKIHKGGKLTIDNSKYPGAQASWDFTNSPVADYAVESFPQQNTTTIDNTKGLAVTQTDFVDANTFGIIIPEQKQTAIEFKYTLASTASPAAFAAQTATYTYPLNNFGKWEMGKKYVYEITINFGEITINPSVTAWDAQNAEDVQI